ncbi:MAG: hypothetical protein MJE68_17970, partial [Proteobacteria bacterium]|nr:hypothetical protein [Pseudomonadota bacterium]
DVTVSNRVIPLRHFLKIFFVVYSIIIIVWLYSLVRENGRVNVPICTALRISVLSWERDIYLLVRREYPGGRNWC